MARPREFDPDVALDRAMELFWRRGYHATSLTDLTEHLGIGRASLYATFGSKHELYVRALDRYRCTRTPSPVEVLARPGPALPAIRTLLDTWASTAATGPSGCLMVNAAVERQPDDRDVAAQLHVSWDELEDALSSALCRAADGGEIAPDAAPRPLARLLLVVMQGMQVLRRCEDQSARLRDAADQAFALLPVRPPVPVP